MEEVDCVVVQTALQPEPDSNGTDSPNDTKPINSEDTKMEVVNSGDDTHIEQMDITNVDLKATVVNPVAVQLVQTVPPQNGAHTVETSVTESTNQTNSTAAVVTESTNQTSSLTAAVTESTNQTSSLTAAVTESTNQTSSTTATVTESTHQTSSTTATVTESINQTSSATTEVTESTSQTSIAAAGVTGSTSQTSIAAAGVTESTSQTSIAAAGVTESINQTSTAAEVTESTKPTSSTSPEDTPLDQEPTTLQKYWQSVKENPNDFTGWTYLLQYVEQENDLEAARVAFAEFLKKYPYCYGYWKKYADLEAKNNNFLKAEEIYMRGAHANALCVDLWWHFIQFVLKRYSGSEEGVKHCQRLFEQALTAAGTDFKSDKLWTEYVNWAKEKKQLQYEIYGRVLKIPTYEYRIHYKGLCDLVKENNPKDVLSVDEFISLRKQIVLPDHGGEVEKEDISVPDAAPPGLEPDAPPGMTSEETPPGVDPVQKPPGTEKVSVSIEEEECEALRKLIIEKWEKVHRATEEQVSRRWNYETAIRRPYFHVKPLEKSQLRNWREYLDMEIEAGSHERVLVLFERCMVACALYEEFWLKYARYLQKHGLTEAVQNVYRRACDVHLPKQASLHLHWSAYEESIGNIETAAKILDNIEHNIPGLAMISLRRISLQRRHKQYTEVEKLYKHYIDDSDTDQERSFYVIKYARFLTKVMDRVDDARKLLEDTISKDTVNHKLYLQLIDTEYHRVGGGDLKILEVFNRAINSPLALEHRVAFSQRKIEFLEDFGANVTTLMESYDNHQKLQKELQMKTKKRKATEATGQGDTTQVAKKEKVETTQTTAATTTQTTTTAPATSTTTTTAQDNSYYGHQQQSVDYSQQQMGYNYPGAWPPPPNYMQAPPPPNYGGYYPPPPQWNYGGYYGH